MDRDLTRTEILHVHVCGTLYLGQSNAKLLARIGARPSVRPMKTIRERRLSKGETNVILMHKWHKAWRQFQPGETHKARARVQYGSCQTALPSTHNALAFMMLSWNAKRRAHKRCATLSSGRASN